MNRFDKAAKTWDSKPTSVAIAKACVKNIKKYIDIEQDIKILDYGCGTGLVAIAISNESNEVELLIFINTVYIIYNSTNQ